MSNYQKKSGFAGKAVISVLLAGVVAAGVCCAGYASRNEQGEWFKNSDLSSWHWSDKAPDENADKDTNNEINDDGGADLGDAEENGVRVLKAKLPKAAWAANGVPANADSAYTLNVNIIPDYATDKAVDWVLSWANSESEWATGKEVTDYVTVTPNAEDNSALLVCLQDFGEPIVLTVSSVSNPEVFAHCFINYYQRVKACEYVITLDGEEVTPTIENGVYKVDYTGAEKDYAIELRPVYSAYTLEETYTTEINGAFTSSFGYTAATSLTALKIPAGLNGGDPALSENALNWCKYYEEQVFSYEIISSSSSVYLGYANMGSELLKGNTINAYGNTIRPKYKLTEEEKHHPRCAYYLSILPSGTFNSADDYNSRKNQYLNYKPADYTYIGGVVIPSYNEFVASVNRCNTDGVGVIDYSININGEHSNYTTTLSLGYGELKVKVQNVELSDGSINF